MRYYLVIFVLFLTSALGAFTARPDFVDISDPNIKGKGVLDVTKSGSFPEISRTKNSITYDLGNNQRQVRVYGELFEDDLKTIKYEDPPLLVTPTTSPITKLFSIYSASAATTSVSGYGDNRMLSAAAYQNNNDGASTAIDVGYINSTYGNGRMIIKMVTPVIDGTIGTSSLFLTPTANSTTNFGLYWGLRNTWTELGSTWLKYDGVNNWTDGGGDMATTSGALATSNSWTQNVAREMAIATGTPLQFNTTYTFILKAITEGSGSSMQIYSEEHATVAYRPYMIVNYSVTSTPSSCVCTSSEEMDDDVLTAFMDFWWKWPFILGIIMLAWAFIRAMARKFFSQSL